MKTEFPDMLKPSLSMHICVDYQLRELGSMSVKVCIIESSSSIIPARNQIN